MEAAAQYLVGEHDFQNFCKLDSTGEKTTMRRVNSVKIDRVEENPIDPDSGYNLARVKICGHAFVWHQIRCIMAVLIQIGKGLEDISIIKELLDIHKHPKYVTATLVTTKERNCEYF